MDFCAGESAALNSSAAAVGAVDAGCGVGAVAVRLIRPQRALAMTLAGNTGGEQNVRWPRQTCALVRQKNRMSRIT